MRSGSISDRTTRFLETTLDADTTKIEKQLSQQHIHISLDPTVANSFTGQAILFMLLNLLVRLDRYSPHIHVVVPIVPQHSFLRLLLGGLFHEALKEFFAPFPAARRLTITTVSSIIAPTDIQIVVSPVPKAEALSIWSNGWIIYLNEHAPEEPGDANSVGTSVVAGIAASEIFKRLIRDIPLRPGLKIVPLNHLVFSTYDYSLFPGDNPPLPAIVDIDKTIVVGLGGIGAGFTAAAASLPALSGKLTFIDKDELDETNLNRQLIARPGDMGAKVDLCRRALAFHPDVDTRTEWFEDYVASHGDRQTIVVVGVDNDRVRREIQASLPYLILNAGTSDVASFRVTRHNYIDGACLSCISRADLQDHPVERELAHRLGLDLTTILEYQHSGIPLSTDMLQRTGKLSEYDIERLGNQPLSEIQLRLCAQIALGTRNQEAAVSISFLSAIPGFLLLGELIKEKAYSQILRPPLNQESNHMLWAIFGQPHPKLLHGWRDKLSTCDCNRTPYQQAYHRKWDRI